MRDDSPCLHLQTVHIYDADSHEFIPTTADGLPSEVYHVKITRGILFMKQQGHEVRFVLRRVRGTSKSRYRTYAH